MTDNDLFSKAQHGFIKGKSCVTQLLEFLEDITQAIDNGEDVDVVYLDFCKAFDKVPHKRLFKNCMVIELGVKYLIGSKKSFHQENKE